MFNKNFSFLWRKYKFRSIVVKNSLKLFLIFSMILTLPMGGMYILLIRNARTGLTEENFIANKKISATVEALMRDTEYLVGEMMADPELEYFLSGGENADYTEEERAELINKISAYKSGKRLIDSIYVYAGRSGFVCSDSTFDRAGSFYDMTWLEEFNKHFEDNCKVIVKKDSLTGRKILALMKKHTNKRGGIIINMDLGQLPKYVRELFYNGDEFYIVDKYGVLYTNVVSSKRDALIEERLAEMISGGETSAVFNSEGGRRVCAVTEKSAYYDWHYARICSGSENERVIKITLYSLFFVIFLLLGLIIVCSMSLSMSSVSQVRVLLELFENKEIYKSLAENEISEIAERIIRIMDDNEKLNREIKEKNSEYEKMTMKALQMQMTPHFLNNTLAIINFEAVESFNGENKISDMISKISQMLRYTLVSDRILVPLGEELTYIENYIELLKIRYGNFEITLDVDDEVRDMQILRMCMQPLIENAVFHGLEKNGGHIAVACKKTDDGMYISVEDDGVGMTRETISRLERSFKEASMEERNVGLKNVYRRLKLIFADKAEMKIESVLGKYTRVVMEITDTPENN